MALLSLLSPEQVSALALRFSSGTKTEQIETWLRTLGHVSVRGRSQILKLYLLSKAGVERRSRVAPTMDDRVEAVSRGQP